MSTNPDSQLIERCQRGDDEAFRELIEQHKRLVFALIARSIRDQARAEELAQEVFLRVYRGLRYFRGEARLATWIYRIAINVLAEERRPGRPIEVSLDEPAPGRDGPRFEPGGEDSGRSATWNCRTGWVRPSSGYRRNTRCSSTATISRACATRTWPRPWGSRWAP